MLIARKPEHGAERARPGLLDRVFTAALESPLAAYLGDRSYSVYILHSPIIVLAGYVLFPLYDFTREEALVAMTLLIVPTILIASELMYRFVERPMIRLGARVADRLAIATATPLTLAKPNAPAI